jgi:uncharacterized membrane protein YhhN
MTQVAWVLLALAGGFAVVDWIGVVHHDRRLRLVAKPAVMILLAAVALSLQPSSGAQRDIFVAALFLCLLGDVFLLSGSEGWFMAGLAAFLGAHLAYSDGFLVGGFQRSLLPYSAAATAIASLAFGGRIVGALVGSKRTSMLGPVLVYLLAISSMVTLAGATGKPAAITGAILFYVSDGLIAWNRFVRPSDWTRLPVIVTYHLGQAALILSLAS